METRTYVVIARCVGCILPGARGTGRLSGRSLVICFGLLISCFTAQVQAAITFVQRNSATPQSPQSTVSASFTNAQTAGNLTVVVVGWNDSTAAVSSLTDSEGTVYTRAVGPTVRSGQVSQSIYYGNTVAAAAGANIVTVQFTVPANYADIRILEYGGIAPANPIDVTRAATGANKASSSGAATTTNANDLIFGANTVATSTSGAGTGFTNRIITQDGDIAEDRIVSAVGSYSASAPLSSAGAWVMQMVAFRASSGVVDTTSPTAPSNLVATAAGSGAINLSWTASTDNVEVTGYRVERCQGVGCTSFAQVGTSTGATYADTGLSANASYGYRVRAADTAGNLSSYSNTAAATTTQADTTPPTAPSNLIAAAVGSSGINLSWTASTDDVGVTNYLVERCQAAGCVNFVQVGFAAGTTYADTGLLPNTSYSYRTRATDAAANLSAYSNTGTATTAQAAAGPITFIQRNYVVPQTPQSTVSVSYTNAQTAGNMNVVVVGWSDSTSVVNSVIDSKGNVYTGAVGPTAQAGIHSQSIYYANNIVAAAAGANTVTVAFTAAVPYPDIRILEYSGLDPVSPVDAVATATGTSTTSSTPAMATRNADDLIFAANTVATSTTGPGTGFTNRVITSPDGNIAEDRIVTATGSYGASAPLSSSGGWVMQMVAFRTPGGVADTTPPTTPSNLVATAPGSSAINLSWTASTDNVGVTGYRVERCLGAGCTSFAQVATLSGTSYADMGLVGGTSYSYRVRAADPTGNLSGYSNTATATTAPPTPGGKWSSVLNWPLVAVHASLMPSGKVLVWDYVTSGQGTQVWDPATNAFTAVPYGTQNLFCAAHAELPDGRVLVAGGHANNYVGTTGATIFNSATQSWSDTAPMSFARWYPTVTALPDGRMLVTSGSINSQSNVAAIPEVYSPVSGTWTQLNYASLPLPLYPHMFVLPDGRVLVTGSYEQKVVARALDLNTQTWSVVDPVAVEGGSAAMYLPGKVIMSGKGTAGGADITGIPSGATTYVLDATQATPRWRQTASMAYQRDYHNLTVLPDGTVLVTGGGRTTGATDASTAVYEAELWSPLYETWTTMAAMQVPRLYHSTALLLPDGRVLVAGGGRNNGVGAPTSANDHLNAEIYSPPYLLFGGARPVITSAPSAIQYGTDIFVGTPDAANISSVSFIRLGSVTHAFNMNQRFVPLTFQQAAGGLTIQAPGPPGNANLAPPGYYMLFLVNGAGVPSIGAIIKIQ